MCQAKLLVEKPDLAISNIKKGEAIAEAKEAKKVAAES